MYNLGKEYLEKDWVAEGKVTSIKQQGQCGACWAFSAAAAIESAQLIDKKINSDLSEQHLVHCSQYDCKGGWMSTTFNWIKKRGIQYEQDYPYTGKDGTCNRNNGETVKIRHFNSINSNNMFEFLSLLATRPVTLPITITNDMYKYRSGLFDEITDNGNNHAVVAVGYFIDENNPRESFIRIKNSWGTNWGENGFIRLRLQNVVKTNGVLNILNTGSQIIAPIID